MKRYCVVFVGRVQGVGFRYILADKANEYNLKGNVRNLYNGNVEAHLEGDEKRIIQLINYFVYNPGFIRIDNYSMFEEELQYEDSFKIIY